MVHKSLGWLFGYLCIRFRGEGMERFINLCHHHGINLWQIYPDSKGKEMYACISLKDYKQIRNIARKTKVWPRIAERHGAPFVWVSMKQRKSFFAGLVLFLGLVLFFSTRIWAIDVAGESYHTQESLLRYLRTQQVYSGMAGKQAVCSQIEEQMRKQYEDIGWVSVKKSGSKLYIQLQEVRLVEAETEKQPSHLVASCKGTVVQIVTRQGTAKVHQGDKVKKGAVLISGAVNIIGDNDTMLGKQYVEAQGDIMIENTKQYHDELPVKEKRKVYTGREKKIYQWNFGGKKFCLHNVLNHLERGQKYDIIRDGGGFCDFLSVYFPMEYWVTTYRFTEMQEQEYEEAEAAEILEKRLQNYLYQKQEQGNLLQQSDPVITRQGDRYICEDQIVWWKKQQKRRVISDETIQREESKRKQDGNNGDVD
ncbi:MAG: sporulation protein YqfD [Lachnospiraceae bacterium]|nr:sporulation protein YqfD [Lachnospiraceae bacterium]